MPGIAEGPRGRGSGTGGVRRPARAPGALERAEIAARAREFARAHWQILLVAGIMGLAFGVRMYYLAKHTEYTADSYYFLILARSIKETFTYTVRGITHTKYLPGYPIAIWLGGYLFGGLERSANMLAVLGATFASLATYGLGRELFGRRVGVVAALLVALQPTFLKWTCLPMTEGLFTFLFAGGLYLVLTGCRRASPARRLTGAAAGGFCFLVRWEGLLFLPLMVLIVLLYIKGSKLKAWEPIVMLAAFGLPIAVYVTRNLIVTGKVTSYIGEYRDYSTDLSFAVLKHRLKAYGWNGMSDAAFSALFYLGALWLLVRRKWKGFLVTAGWFALFLFMHLFWYYAYERFMAPAIPAVALVISFLFVDLAMLARSAFAPPGPVSGKTGDRPGRRAGRRPLALAAVWLALAAGFGLLLLHGTARAVTVIEHNYLAFSDDHGGRGMAQAADWLNANAPGQVVACDAGPYFNWLYHPGDVVYLRPVPWDLPVEPGEIPYVDVPTRLYERGIRYMVVGQTEEGLDKELELFGVTGSMAERLRPVASWENEYRFPSPHRLETVIFEVLPPG